MLGWTADLGQRPGWGAVPNTPTISCMKPLEKDQQLAIVPEGAQEQHLATPLPQRIGLAPLDQFALRMLVSDNPATAVEHARGLAEALVGPDRDGARLRVLARGIATCETQRALLEAMLMERLARRDGEGVELVERVLRNLSARVFKLIEAHRQESLVQQRPVLVAVGHADAVNIGAVEE